MLIRVLVAVLTLLGPMPLRVCTCAASAVPSPELVRPSAPAPAKSCRCNHSATSTRPVGHAVRSGLSKPAGSVGAADDSRGRGHAPGCPAISPRTVVRDLIAVPLPVDASPADAAGLPTAMVTSPAHTPNREGRAVRAIVPSAPLYLSLLVLRL